MLDVGPGDHVTVDLPLSAETIQLFVWIWHSGAVLCPLNSRLPDEAKQVVRAAMGETVRVDQNGMQRLHEARRPEEEDLALLLQTSGTTGQPKIAGLSLDNLRASAPAVNEALGFDESGTWMLTLPLWHVSGLAPLFRCFAAGARWVLPGGNWLQTLTEEHVTHVSLVPTQLRELLAIPVDDLQAILVGGAACPQELLDAATQLPIHVSYGMTEMASTICCDGKVLEGRSVRLAEDGEVEVDGPMRFLGYWKGKKLERVSGWFPTGDLGEWEDDGSLSVIGRKDRMLISGGENVHAEEVEAVLNAIPGVSEAKVEAQYDKAFGERPIATVVSEGVTQDQILAALERKLPKYKIPVSFTLKPPR